LKRMQLVRNGDVSCHSLRNESAHLSVKVFNGNVDRLVTQ
jgi:hypothetical protein